MTYIVREISGKEEWEDFLSIPAGIYSGDPNWITPQLSGVKRVLDSARNPYFANAILKVYVCYLDNKPVSRSVMVINRLHWTRWHKKSAFFGFFESPDKSDAVSHLFNKIEEDSRALGAEYLEGPFNPNHYSELGILIDNFNSPPVFFETYNPPYYSKLLYGAGFSELYRFHTRINENISAVLAKYPAGPELHINDKDIVIRKFNILKMKRDLEIMRDINNDAFENNWYFLPLTKDEYKFSARFLFFVTMPGLIEFAEYKGQPVGVLQCVINFNRLIKPLNGRIRLWHIPGLLLKRNRLKELIIFTVGIKKAFQHTGVSAMMIKSSMKILQKYSTVSTTWISDENKPVIHISDLFGMKPWKYFSIYSKKL